MLKYLSIISKEKSNLKKYLLMLALLAGLNSCFLWDGDDENFMNVYKEILIVREKFPDTSLANPKVRDIYLKYGYSEQSFRETYEHYAKTNPEHLLEMIDSVRSAAKIDLVKEMELEKKRKEAEYRKEKEKELAAKEPDSTMTDSLSIQQADSTAKDSDK